MQSVEHGFEPGCPRSWAELRCAYRTLALEEAVTVFGRLEVDVAAFPVAV
jgi:hypothetical protein